MGAFVWTLKIFQDLEAAFFCFHYSTSEYIMLAFKKNYYLVASVTFN